MLKINVIIAISLLGLSACGGGGGGGSPAPVIKNGVFKDSNVSGLSYVSGSKSGKTNQGGEFQYEDGSNVNFSLEKIDFGTGKGQPLMTPLDLVDNGTLNSTEVINRVRLLMMLDKDNTPSNGIEISTKVQDKAKDWEVVDFASDNFSSNVSSIVVDASVEDAISHALPSIEDATAHLKTTLICSFSGAFVGDYTGSEGGNLALIVDPVSGTVKGSSYNPDNQVSVEVNSIADIDLDNDLAFETGEDSAKKFSGKLASSNEMQGSWENVADTSSTGSFSASRLGGENSAVFRYSVAFNGDELGVYAFNVSTDNQITGTAYNVSTGVEQAITGTLADHADNTPEGLDNKLVLNATLEDQTVLFALIDENTLEINGQWDDNPNLHNGDFSGGGCRLN